MQAGLLGEILHNLRGVRGTGPVFGDYVAKNIVALNVATKEHMDYLISTSKRAEAFQERLKSAAEKASRTPLKTSEGPLEDWAVGHAVVVLDSYGNLLGYDVTPGSEKNLHYALTKAACMMLLDDPNVKSRGDVLAPNSIKYLEGFGLEFGGGGANAVFLGGIKPVVVDGETCYFAGGSCGFNWDNPKVKGYLEKKMQAVASDKFTMAGAAEMQIAEITAHYVAHPEAEIEPQEETWLLKFLPMLH